MRVYLDVCEFFVFVCIYVCLSGDVCGRVSMCLLTLLIVGGLWSGLLLFLSFYLLLLLLVKLNVL